MTSGIKPGLQSKPGPGGFPSAPITNQAILLEKLNRQSTPDSEALASSDDEGDTHNQESHPPAIQPQKPVRRASWLNDTSQAAIRPRKESFASSTMSPTTSHPSTPPAESGVGTWGSHSTSSAVLTRPHTGSSSFPWGAQIWTNKREDPPSRLAEMLPSPTSGLPPGSNSFFGDGMPTQTSPAPRDQGPNPQIPFAIPLHPTPKTYRSQSYSVGQLEADATTATMGPSAVMGGRGRPMPHSGLQHRPSRPSMLSEMSNDGGMLGKVKEVEDDDDQSLNDSQGSQQQAADAKTIEMLTRENALLRQHASQQQQQQYSRIRPRAASSYGLGNGYGLHEAVPEESDYAIDELEEANDGGDLTSKRNVSRRMSEFGSAGTYRSPYTQLENRKLENVKKAFWQSSLGFGGQGGGGDMSQSRRHSFADVPTRQASISSISETVLTQEPGSLDPQQPQDFTSPYSDTHAFPTNPPQSYFTGGAALPAAHQSLVGGGYGYQSPYGMHSGFSNRPASPHRGMYGMTQPNRSTPLHVVLFKCARADVFYIQEGTGLTVKPGDLVIVEADRGTDLGTVAVDNVDWVEAKRLKEHYAEEQYKWLMMYSQNAGVAQEGVGAGLMAASNGMQGSAVGGMGPPGQHHIQEPNAGELKPKLIKRLAQNHEVHSLREKEGNEAKAKRVCMQKVKEHGLNMEILDAEFQMDWKKLTFYYFADSYINFNSLVTDLFKIYKTRIWMSAINPASFASQPLGLQAPSGIGPGAVGVGRGAPNTEQQQRRPNQPPEQPPSAFTTSSQPNRPFPQGAMNPQFGSDRSPAGTGPAAYPPSFPYSPYAAFGNVPRAPAVPYGSGMMPPADSYTAGFPQSADYQSVRGRFPSPQTGSTQHEQSISPLAAQNEWVGALHGLSLNSR